jgi:hypothetical protein
VVLTTSDDEQLTGIGAPPSPRRAAPARHRRARPRSHWRVFALAAGIVFCAMALWSAATPVYAAPDEPVHVIKAAAVVRGQLVGQTAGASQEAFAMVRVPGTYGLPANRNDPTCFHRRPTVPASCAPAITASSAPTDSWIYVARYPPLYYAIVGLPSLLSDSPVTIYAMRLVSALLSALMIGLAAMVAVRWSRRRLTLVGVAVATTPMVLFLGGVVNPSGFEVSSAIAAWTCGAVLVLEHLEDPPPGLIAALGVSCTVLELIRSLSPFWLALTALFLVAVSDLRRLRALLRRRDVQIMLAVALGLGALACAWIIGEHSTAVYARGGLGPTSELTILETSFAHTDFYLPTMIGVFGWFDTWAPTFTYVAWYGLVGVLVLLAAVLGRRRDALVLAALVIAILVVPVIISTSQVHRYGYTWSGRDTLPLAVGLPILASVLIDRTGISTRAVRLAGRLMPLVVLAQFGAFYEALRRYAVGTRGPDFGFLLHASWAPPGGFALLLAAEAAVLVVGTRALVRAVRQAPPPDPDAPTGRRHAQALA